MSSGGGHLAPRAACRHDGALRAVAYIFLAALVALGGAAAGLLAFVLLPGSGGL